MKTWNNKVSISKVGIVTSLQACICMTQACYSRIKTILCKSYDMRVSFMLHLIRLDVQLLLLLLTPLVVVTIATTMIFLENESCLTYFM